jgi:hypothetical protein
VGGRIADHLLQAGASAALPLAAALGNLTGLLQPLYQLIPNLLQLRHVGDVAFGAEQRVGRLAGLPGLRGVGGELRLEAGDLAAQLAPAR